MTDNNRADPPDEADDDANRLRPNWSSGANAPTQIVSSAAGRSGNSDWHVTADEGLTTLQGFIDERNTQVSNKAKERRRFVVTIGPSDAGKSWFILRAAHRLADGYGTTLQPMPRTYNKHIVGTGRNEVAVLSTYQDKGDFPSTTFVDIAGESFQAFVRDNTRVKTLANLGPSIDKFIFQALFYADAVIVLVDTKVAIGVGDQASQSNDIRLAIENTKLILNGIGGFYGDKRSKTRAVYVALSRADLALDRNRPEDALLLRDPWKTAVEAPFIVATVGRFEHAKVDFVSPFAGHNPNHEDDGDLIDTTLPFPGVDACLQWIRRSFKRRSWANATPRVALRARRIGRWLRALPGVDSEAPAADGASNEQDSAQTESQLAVNAYLFLTRSVMGLGVLALMSVIVGIPWFKAPPVTTYTDQVSLQGRSVPVPPRGLAVTETGALVLTPAERQAFDDSLGQRNSDIWRYQALPPSLPEKPFEISSLHIAGRMTASTAVGRAVLAMAECGINEFRHCNSSRRIGLANDLLSALQSDPDADKSRAANFYRGVARVWVGRDLEQAAADLSVFKGLANRIATDKPRIFAGQRVAADVVAIKASVRSGQLSDPRQIKRRLDDAWKDLQLALEGQQATSLTESRQFGILTAEVMADRLVATIASLAAEGQTGSAITNEIRQLLASESSAVSLAVSSTKETGGWDKLRQAVCLLSFRGGEAHGLSARCETELESLLPSATSEVGKMWRARRDVKNGIWSRDLANNWAGMVPRARAQARMQLKHGTNDVAAQGQNQLRNFAYANAPYTERVVAGLSQWYKAVIFAAILLLGCVLLSLIYLWRHGQSLRAFFRSGYDVVLGH